MTDDARGEDLESENPEVVRAALRKRMDALRVGEEPDPIDLAEAVVALARHARPSVRQAAAEACAHLPDPHGELALSTLREDSDAYVQRAADRASKLRAVRRKERARDELEGNAVTELLEQMATKDERQHDSVVVAGDWNTCTAIDGAGRDLAAADHLKGLQQRGWRSAFRAVHPESSARSWWHARGTGFRIDDVYVSPGFAGTLRSAEYVTSVGGHDLAWDHQGTKPASTLSDHAALVVDLEAPASVAREDGRAE